MWSIVFAIVIASVSTTIHVDSTGWATRAAKVPAALEPGDIFWAWSPMCPPHRLRSGDGSASTCSAGTTRTIRITDPAGHPVPDTNVRWGTTAMIREIPDSLLPEEKTDDQGNLCFRVPADVEIFARVAGPKFGSLWIPVSSKRQRTELRAEPAIDLDFAVTDTAGATAARARLALQTLGLPQPANLTIHDLALDGRTTFKAIPRVALIEITAWNEDLLPGSASGKAASLTRRLALQHGARITALLIDSEKKPVANAKAEMIIPIGDGHTGLRRTAESDKKGFLTLCGARAGRTSWRITKPSWTSVLRMDDLRTGENRLGVLLMARGRDVPITVVDENDRAVSKAIVQTADGAVRTETNGKGLATLGSIAIAGTTDALVKATGFLPHSFEIGAVQKGQLKVRLERGVVVTARIVSENSHQPAGPGSVFIDNNGAKFTRLIDADGVLDIGGLQEGSLTLEIRADSFPSYRVSTRSVRKNEKVDLGTIALTAGLSIEGLVVDAQSGAPLADARIRSPRVHKEGPRLARVLNDYVEGTSDETGHFALKGLVAGDYRMVVEARDHAPLLMKGISLRDDASAGVLDLGMIEVPEAHTLEVRCTPAPRCGDRADVLIGGDEEDWAALHIPIVDGRGLLPAVPPGEFVVRLTDRSAQVAEKQVVVSSSEDSTTVSFKLSTVDVSGEVWQRGKRVSGGEVHFVSSGSTSAQVPIFVTRNSEYGPVGSEVVGSLPRAAEVTVDTAGRFLLRDFSPGSYRVTYESAAGQSPPREIVVPDAETYPIRIDLTGADVGGAIVDEKGSTPIWCTVRVTDAQGQNHTTTAEADGRFSLIGLPAGRASVRAWNDESEDLQSIDLREGERQDLHLVLKPGDSKRTVTVLDAAGRPVSRAAVFLASGADLRTEVTGSDGVATFNGLDPKEQAAVGAYGAGLGWAFSICSETPVSVTLSGPGGLLSIQAEKPSPVAIVTPQGFPLHRALSLLGLHTGVRPTGPFALGGLPDGDYTVDVGGIRRQARISQGTSIPLHF